MKIDRLAGMAASRPGHISGHRANALHASRRLLVQEQGQTLVEYSLIVSLFAVALVAIMTVIGGDIDGFYQGVRGQLEALEL